MTVHLPEDVESSIRAEVQSGHFASADDAVAEAWRAFLRHREKPVTQDASEAVTPEPAWKRVLQNMDAVPDEAFDRIPADSSEQLDHYLYGSPRRPPA